MRSAIHRGAARGAILLWLWAPLSAPAAEPAPAGVDAGEPPPVGVQVGAQVGAPADTREAPVRPRVLVPVVDDKVALGRRGRAAVNPRLLEAQNHGQLIATRYAQLLLSGDVDQAVMMHDFPGGRRPDIAPLRAACEGRGVPNQLVRVPILQAWAETTSYYFEARYPDGPPLPLRVTVDHAGHIAGAAVGPQAEIRGRLQRYERFDQYQLRAALDLPFQGEWVASSATPGPANGHYLNANQRFAMDWLIYRGGKTCQGRCKDNADYYAYGQPILAPSGGTVVQVVDGVPDNTPGQVDVYFRLGNVVVIALGAGEFAYLCHLQQGSIGVRVGDTVRRGQVLARCGNSGNSSEPHLHFQVGDGPLISRAASLPVQFRRVRRNGKVAERAQPQDGERFEPL